MLNNIAFMVLKTYMKPYAKGYMKEKETPKEDIPYSFHNAEHNTKTEKQCKNNIVFMGLKTYMKAEKKRKRNRIMLFGCMHKLDIVGCTSPFVRMLVFWVFHIILSLFPSQHGFVFVGFPLFEDTCFV